MAPYEFKVCKQIVCKLINAACIITKLATVLNLDNQYFLPEAKHMEN